MVERNETNNGRLHSEQSRTEEPLIIEEGVPFYPFTPDMKLPSSEELVKAFFKKKKTIRI